MAGSLTASVHEHHAEASETSRWLISFARFIPFPSSPAPYRGLVPLGKSELSSSPVGTWLSTSVSTEVYLRLVDKVKRSDVILSIELAGKILEEHYITKLNFSWPHMTSVSGFPPRGSRAILVSYKDSANEIQKFALRFSTCDAAVTFVVALKEKLKGLEEAGLQEREPRSDASFQSDCNPVNETIHRAIVEEPNMVKHLGSYVPEMQPRLEYQTGQTLYTPQGATEEEPNRVKPPDSHVPAMQSRLEYQTGQTLYPPHFTTVEEPNMVKHLGSYVPEIQPRLEYQAGQILYPPQSTLIQIPNEPFSNLPPSFTTLLSDCFPNSTLDAGQTAVKQDPDLKSQILEKLKGLEEVGIQERETRSETSLQSDYNPGNEIIPRAMEEEFNMFKPPYSYVPEMLPRLEYQQTVYPPQSATAEEPNMVKHLGSSVPERQPRVEYQTGQIIYSPQFTTVEESNMVEHLGSYVPEMQPRLENEELPEGSAALLAKNSQTPRQGTVASKVDAIVMEAENLARLADSQSHTPLLGGENPDLHPSDFTGVTPGKEEIQTPDPMLSPSMNPGAAAAALTPRLGLTPSRDELHLNEDMDMHESEELMIGEKTELEAKEENAEKTLVTLKLLCPRQRMNTFYREVVDNIIDNEKRVSIKVEDYHFVHDDNYIIISMSALEVFGEENSPTLEAARQLFSCCCHCKGKTHLKRLLIGDSRIFLLAVNLVSFESSYISFWRNESPYEIEYSHNEDKKIWTIVRMEPKCLTIEIRGSYKEVKRAFEESIVELRRKCFTFLPQ